MQFQTTISVSYAQVERIASQYQPGQWVKIPSGARGQYLGETHAGPVINWVHEKFDKQHAKANKALRQYAKVYGSK